MRTEPPGALMKCECAHCTCDLELRLDHPPIRFVGHELQGDINWTVRVSTLEGMINVCARCWDEHYKRAAPVPDKLKIEWSRRNICPNCGVENLYPSGKSSSSGPVNGSSSEIREFGLCGNCGVGFGHVGLKEGGERVNWTAS